MIATCHLMGGLGNCLFQIATTYAYAKKYEKDMILYADIHVPAHNYISSYFNNILRNTKFEIKEVQMAEYMEPAFQYTPLPKMVNDVKLHGYFQSPMYFEEFESDIRELFKIDKFTHEYLQSKYGLILNENTCSIHIRRGDYVNLQNFHPVQDVSYYKTCIKKYTEDTIFLVFSDDIEWCKKTFGENRKLIYIEGNKDFEDLYLMSLCKHNIIANSTFSWWGAYLNSNKDKIVCAPKIWFGPALSYHNTKDLYCKTWIVC